MKTVFLSLVTIIGLVVLGGLAYLAFSRAEIQTKPFEQEIVPMPAAAVAPAPLAPVTAPAVETDPVPPAPAPATPSVEGQPE